MSVSKVVTGDTGTDLYLRTKTLYMADMETDPSSQWGFNERIFANHFACAAHEHNIWYHEGARLVIDLTPEQKEDRRLYNLYYGTASIKLRRFLETKRREAEKKKTASDAALATPCPQERLFPGASRAEERTNQARIQLEKLSQDSMKPKQLNLPGFIPEEVARFIRELHARFDKMSR